MRGSEPGKPGATTTTRDLAVVTGASSGIGYELAKQFAEHDFDLIVAAEGDAIHDAARELEALGANVEAVQVDLADAHGAARSGRILFTSSIASTMPGAVQAVYNASKSFGQSFALALRSELKDSGVTVTSLMPGPTETEFFERADMLDTRVGTDEKDDAADVARDGFDRS
jgi:short-subunit dehydrogenase